MRTVSLDRETQITLDLHGKNQFQARIALDAALRRSKGVYRIRIIHGCHSGAALRDLVWREYVSHPKVLSAKAVSESVTDLILREW